MYILHLSYYDFHPFLSVDIVPKTKKMMKSAAAVVNDLMPQPRLLDNHRVRAKNLGLECCLDFDDDVVCQTR
jgi:hypothetical protein